MACDHLSSTLSSSNCPLCCRPPVFPVALLRSVYGGTVPAMDAVPPMPVEEHQVLDPRIVRQSIDEIQLRHRRAASASLLRVEFANAHESPCARLLGESCGFRNGHFGTCSGTARYRARAVLSTDSPRVPGEDNRLWYNSLQRGNWARSATILASDGAFDGAPGNPKHVAFR